MRIIKVDAIKSTNEFVRGLYRESPSRDAVCVMARLQTHGKGQRGAGWKSNEGENLTFSVFYPKINISVSRHFALSAAVSIAVTEALKSHKIPNIKVKWPNDIMSAKFKIGGILIENILREGQIAASVIGIGLNVNQIDFPGLPQAGSLRKLTGRTFELDDLLQDILKAVEGKLEKLPQTNDASVIEEYTAAMFRKDEVSTFQLPDGNYLTGIIRGITGNGKLQLEVENSEYISFDFKEVKLLF